MTYIPETMKALLAVQAVPEEAVVDTLLLQHYLRIEDVPVPLPGPGQVLIRVSRATLNPNDLYHIKGVYTGTRDVPFPRPLGFEGAGVVVASGGGLVGRFRVGSRVAFYAMGMLAEYVLCDALNLIDIPKGMDFSTAACSVANPMTALSMLDVVRAAGAKHVINTAAASALGRLLIRLGKQRGIEMICVVRREEQMAICREAGAIHVLNSSAPDFDARLQQVCAETGCYLALDCVGGDMPERLLNALPEMGGTVKLYGYMTPGPLKLSPQTLFAARRLETFEVNVHLAKLSLLSKGLMAMRIGRGMGAQFRSDVQRVFPLSEGVEAFAFYSQNMTAGKVQIAMDDGA